MNRDELLRMYGATNDTATIYLVIAIIVGFLLLCAVFAIFSIDRNTSLTAQRLYNVEVQLTRLLRVQMGLPFDPPEPEPPPCRACAKKGVVSVLERNPKGKLTCPKCGGVRG